MEGHNIPSSNATRRSLNDGNYCNTESITARVSIDKIDTKNDTNCIRYLVFHQKSKLDHDHQQPLKWSRSSNSSIDQRLDVTRARRLLQGGTVWRWTAINAAGQSEHTEYQPRNQHTIHQIFDFISCQSWIVIISNHLHMTKSWSESRIQRWRYLIPNATEMQIKPKWLVRNRNAAQHYDRKALNDDNYYNTETITARVSIDKTDTITYIVSDI